MDSFRKEMIFVFVLFTVFVCFPLLADAQARQVRDLEIKKMGRADLTVKMMCRDAKPVFSLSKAGREVTIINQGKADAANFYLCLRLAPKGSIPFKKKTPLLSPSKLRCLAKQKILFLKAGQSRVIQFGLFKIPDTFACGEYELIAVVDAENTVPEIDESNNTASCPYLLMARIDHVYEFQSGESYGGMLWESINIYGKRFGSTRGNRKVRFGPHTLDYFQAQDWTDTKIFTDLSKLWESGQYEVYLVLGNRRISNKKTYNLKCWIFDVLPIGGAAPGAQVRVTGRNFGPSQGSKQLKFGSAAAAVVSWSSLEIKAIVPTLPPGSYTIGIEKSGQTICSGVTYTVQ